jgi:hypothetical protein
MAETRRKFDQEFRAGAVVVRDLVQGLVQDGDVIGGRVRPGASFAQESGQRLPATVQETQQRVVAERLFQVEVADSFSNPHRFA